MDIALAVIQLVTALLDLVTAALVLPKTRRSSKKKNRRH